MSNIPAGYAAVPLPSRGVFYDGKMPDGLVHIRKLKVTEEAAIQGASSGFDLVNATVNTAVRCPDGLTPQDLLVTDRMALLLALRVFTFGKTYTYGFKCPACGASNRNDFNLTELATKKAEDGQVEPIEVMLPDCGKRVGLRFLRGKDEAMLARVSKRVAMQSNDPGDVSHILRLALQIATIEGEPAEQHVREAFVRDLTMLDSITMREALDEVEPGVDIRIYPECKSCGFQTEMTLPFTLDFFRPARRTAS